MMLSTWFNGMDCQSLHPLRKEDPCVKDRKILKFNRNLNLKKIWFALIYCKKKKKTLSKIKLDLIGNLI